MSVYSVFAGMTEKLLVWIGIWAGKVSKSFNGKYANHITSVHQANYKYMGLEI